MGFLAIDPLLFVGVAIKWLFRRLSSERPDAVFNACIYSKPECTKVETVTIFFLF
jgi:hypothetical protein